MKPFSIIAKQLPACLAILILCCNLAMPAALAPTTLDRIPALVGQQELWEITKATTIEWADNPVIKYPAGIDVKSLNLPGDDVSLTVICDCGWSRVLFMKTVWGENVALDEFGAFGSWGHDAGHFRFPSGYRRPIRT